MSTLSPRRPAISLAVALLAACASLFAPTVASAASPGAWRAVQVAAAGQAPLFGISCPTTSLCVAVGGGNTIASSTDPPGPASDWSAVNPGGFTQPNWDEIKGVSCPSPQLCVAVSFDGLVLTSANPAGGVGAWNVSDLSPSGPNLHLYGVSCPSPTFCAASAGGAKIATSTNPAGGAAAWSMTQLSGPLELRGISCPSPSFCVVVGDDGDLSGSGPGDFGDQGEILTSTNPLGGVWQQVVAAGDPGNLYGVSCPSPALCVTGNALGDLLVSTDPTGPSAAWPATDGGGSVQLTGVDCPAATRCVAVDNNGDVLTSTDPTGGEWTFTNLIPYGEDPQVRTENAMWGVSCATVTFCAISAAADRVFTSEDPFASPAAVKGTGGAGHKKKHRKGPKRPLTTLAKVPPPSQEITSRKVTVRFRFFATKRVPVSGFICKIDQRPLMRCRSPKNYRVGIGRHHFQVRALGSSGLKGPAARSHFRVCRPPASPPPASLPPCWKGLPPSWQQ